MQQTPGWLARRGRPQGLRSGLFASLILAVLHVSGPAAAQWHAFVHTADGSNSLGNTTLVRHPAIDDDADVVLIVTQLWNVDGDLSGVTNDHQVGVAYSSTTGRWSIYNEDLANIPLGASFNIWVAQPVPSGPLALHTTSVGNTSGNATILQDPYLDDCPGATLQITHNRTPAGGSGPGHDHPVSVAYRSDLGRWTIVNRDGAAMASGVSFNVFPTSLCSTGGTSRAAANYYSFGIHTATVGNTAGSLTRISHRDSDRLSHAIVLATTDSGDGHPLNPHTLGVLYDPFAGGWAIFNQGGADMPLGATFHLLRFPLLLEDGFESGDTSRWSSAVP